MPEVHDAECLAVALIHFVKFIKREPIHVRGTLSSDQLQQVSLEGCLKSTCRHRHEEDAAKRISAIGSYCSPEIVGRFLECTAVQKPGRSVHAIHHDGHAEHSPASGTPGCCPPVSPTPDRQEIYAT